jgi:predicted HTH domain antitoxin
MSITLDIPNRVCEALHVAPGEAEPRLKMELAVALYAQNVLILGKAADLAGMSRLDLNGILARRGISMHYGQKDIEGDLAHAGGRE